MTFSTLSASMVSVAPVVFWALPIAKEFSSSNASHIPRTTPRQLLPTVLPLLIRCENVVCLKFSSVLRYCATPVSVYQSTAWGNLPRWSESHGSQAKFSSCTQPDHLCRPCRCRMSACANVSLDRRESQSLVWTTGVAGRQQLYPGRRH